MQHLPFYIYLVFGTTVIAAIWLFFKATYYSNFFLILLSGWLIIQSVLSIEGFYNSTDTMTARFPLLLFPSLLFIIVLFITKRGKEFIDSLDLATLTIFHIIRIPVEIVLFWLFVNKSIPEAMTFHGRNPDIISGLSAPVVYYFGFVKRRLSKSVILVWNVICLLLLINVILNAILSLPSRFHQFGFEQPNIALGYFPFILLPACLVPLVILATIAAIRQLFHKRGN